MIYVDECAISTDDLSTKSWQLKGQLTPLVRPSTTRVNAIAAYILKGKYAFMLKQGSTKTLHVLKFMDMLNTLLADTFSDDYI